MKKFWNFIRDDEGERILRLEGPIDEDSFWGDEITPKAFRDELEAEEGDVTVWVNSPGGNVFAAAEIYTMLCDHKGKITVKIDAIAASAASVIAMAGDRVLISPVGMIMVHDPMTIAMGNAADMEKAISTLNEVKESIINAYAKKSGLSRNKIAKLMSDETWMNARKAVELGFADEILFSKKDEPEAADNEGDGDGEKEIEAHLKEWQPYSTRIMGQTILNRLVCATEAAAGAGEKPDESADGTQGEEPSETRVKNGQPDPMPDMEAALEDADQKKPKPGEENDPDEEDDPDEGGRPDEDDDPDGDEGSDGDDNPDEDEDPDEDADPEKKRKPPKNKADMEPTDSQPEMPLIGMDGRTEDGAMPYELLKRQLDFLK